MKSSLICLLFPLLIFAAEVKFPVLNEIPPELRIPQNALVTVDSDGNYQVDGKPRFLIGAQIEEKIKEAMAPTTGYPADLKWIYEQVPDYHSMQRLGVDLLGYFTDENWVRKYAPSAKSFFFTPENMIEYRKLWKNYGLPFYVDFTAAPWGNGKMSGLRKNAKIPSEVFSMFGEMSEGHHWVPYCLANRQGREYYRDMWAHGTKALLDSGGKALFYELFNEPAYYDPCPANRALFTEYLRKKYSNVAELNRVWKSRYPDFQAAANFKFRAENPGLYVDWAKFTEAQFTALCREGHELIRGLDPTARTCVQVMGGDLYRALPKSNVNLYEITKFSDVVSLPTGAGCWNISGGMNAPVTPSIKTPQVTGGDERLMRHFFRSIARGKPLHDGECYPGYSAESIHSVLWQQMARGGNAAFLFKWGKRAWDSNWKPAGSEAGGKRVAELLPYHVVNPFALAPKDLPAIMKTKQEFARLNGLFIDRNRRIEHPVALLVSFPSERIAPALGDLGKNAAVHYMSALDFTHFAADVILEEQLAERSKEYRAIVAAGVRNIYPGTVGALRKYVKNGGILILGKQPLPNDEYDHPVDWKGMLNVELQRGTERAGELKLNLPRYELLRGEITAQSNRDWKPGTEWRVIGTLEGKPAVAVQTYGKGRIYFIEPDLPTYSLAALTASILSHEKFTPMAKLTDPGRRDLIANVELHQAKQADGVTGWLLMNADNYPKIIRLESSDLGERTIDLYGSRTLPHTGNGVTILLEPRNRAVAVTGPAQKIDRTYGRFAVQTPADLETRRLAAIPPAPPKEKTDRLKFAPDPRFTRPLDLRTFCNRAFTDPIARDGRGGWTDQGPENSLQGVPWGIADYAGVPAEMIRFDQNENRTCIVLDSKNLSPGFGAKTVTDIPVNAHVRNFYFFHTGAWCDGKTALTYRIHYRSGATANHPVSLNDWWIPTHKRSEAAWMNSQNRGFYVTRFANPRPSDEVKSLDLLSASGGTIPIVVAITIEGFDPAGQVPTPLPATWKTADWGGVKTVRTAHGFTMTPNQNAKEWSGCAIAPSARVPGVKISSKDARLTMEIRTLPDRWGNLTGGQQVQIYLGFGKKKNSRQLNPARFLTRKKIDGEFQRFEIPLRLFSNIESGDELRKIYFQFVSNAPGAGLEIRNIQVE